MAHWFLFWGGGAPPTPVTATLGVTLGSATLTAGASFVTPTASLADLAVTLGDTTVSSDVAFVGAGASTASLMLGSHHDPFTGNTGDTIEAYNPLWTKHPGYTSGSLTITAFDRARPANSNVAGYLWGVAPGTADQVVSAKLVRLSSLAANEQVYLAARMDPAANTMYLGGYDASNGWVLRRLLSGANSLLTSTAATLTQDQVYGVEFRVSGTSLSLWVDGTQVLSTTDSNITAANQTGVRINRSTGAGDTQGVQIDDFTATAPSSVRDITPSASVLFTSGGPATATLSETLLSSTVSATAAFVAATPATSNLAVALGSATVSSDVAFVAAGSRTATLGVTLGSATIASAVSSASPGSAAATLAQTIGTVTVTASAGVVISGVGVTLGVTLDDAEVAGDVTRTLPTASLASLGVTLASWSVSATATTAVMVGPARVNAIPYRSGRVTTQRRAADLD